MAVNVYNDYEACDVLLVSVLLSNGTIKYLRVAVSLSFCQLDMRPNIIVSQIFASSHIRSPT